MKAAVDIINEIDEISRKLDLNDAENLTKAIVALAQRNVGLGVWLADALEAERGLERDLKIKRTQILMKARKGGQTLGEAEAQAIIDTKDLWDELLEIQKATSLYKIKRQDVQTLIETVRSRNSVIKEDIKQETGESHENSM